MPNYIRPAISSSTVFLTICLQDRNSNLLISHFNHLQTAMKVVKNRYPFKQLAWSVMPDHIHCIWKLPEDGNCSIRASQVKQEFSRNFPGVLTNSPSKLRRREKGIWQRRYWEHHIKDDSDLINHMNYIHINPVKHGLVSQSKDWPHSSFNHFVTKGYYDENWGCDLDNVGEFGE